MYVRLGPCCAEVSNACVFFVGMSGFLRPVEICTYCRSLEDLASGRAHDMLL